MNCALFVAPTASSLRYELLLFSLVFIVVVGTDLTTGPSKLLIITTTIHTDVDRWLDELMWMAGAGQGQMDAYINVCPLK